jgi:predicted transcriptional regulator of viral defense system
MFNLTAEKYEKCFLAYRMNNVKLQHQVLRELSRAATEAGRPGIAIPSVDLNYVTERTGSRAGALKAIQRLVKSEQILSIRKDLLVLPDATGLLRIDLVDVIDAIAPRPYLITAGRALEHHHLTDQHFFGIIVLVPREVQKISWRGQTATFMVTKPSTIWGWKSGTRPQYAQPERAVVDALNHPRYGVSLAQVLDALLLGAKMDSRFLDRLLMTIVRLDSKSAARRTGLIVERLFGPERAEPYRQLIGENRNPILLRPRGKDEGPLDSSWRVKVNAIVEPERSSV